MSDKKKAIMGRPTKYKPEYCQQLIDHLIAGHSYQSFAAVCNVNIDTLYEWEQAHEDFSDAKKRGYPHALKYWENLAQLGVTGQMRRTVREKPIMVNATDKDGNLKYDKEGKTYLVPAVDKNGNVLYDREYAPAAFNGVVWMHIAQNRFKDQYKNVQRHAISGDGNGAPIPLKRVEPSAEEKLREIRDVTNMLTELEEADALIEQRRKD